jgi:hypothetical protein
VNEALEGDTVASMVDPCMGTSYPSDGLDRLLKLALSCCQDEYDARPYMIDVTRELEDIWRLIAASYPIPLNKGSDSPSVDFRSIDIAGHSSQTSRVSNAQDMSYLSVEHVDSSEQIHPHLWPRWRRGKNLMFTILFHSLKLELKEMKLDMPRKIDRKFVNFKFSTLTEQSSLLKNFTICRLCPVFTNSFLSVNFATCWFHN